MTPALGGVDLNPARGEMLNGRVLQVGAAVDARQKLGEEHSFGDGGHDQHVEQAVIEQGVGRDFHPPTGERSVGDPDSVGAGRDPGAPLHRVAHLMRLVLDD